jgi:hypothetical protein
MVGEEALFTAAGDVFTGHGNTREDQTNTGAGSNVKQPRERLLGSIRGQKRNIMKETASWNDASLMLSKIKPGGHKNKTSIYYRHRKCVNDRLGRLTSRLC